MNNNLVSQGIFVHRNVRYGVDVVVGTELCLFRIEVLHLIEVDDLGITGIISQLLPQRKGSCGLLYAY